MERITFKRMFLFSAAAILILGSYAFFAYSNTVLFNRSHSLPGSVYLRKDLSALTPGDIYAVCPAKNIAQTGKIIGSLIDSSLCPTGISPLIKILAAKPGDYIEADGIHDIKINGKTFKGSAPRKDSILPVYVFNGRLAADSYLILTPHHDSFDSRYFGTVRKQNFLSHLSLVF